MSERITVVSRAAEAIQRYAQRDPDTGLKPHALWHKFVHNVELDSMQIMKMIEMDQHPNTVDFSVRRSGKTAVKELYLLEFLATTPAQEEGIVAPRVQQSITNLSYHLDAIKRSPMLTAYLATKAGRPDKNDTRYRFENGSKCAAYGIMSQIDGDSITAASIEEIDDMPIDRLMSRFLPMLGAARRMGVDNTKRPDPQIRITGVYKGAGVLRQLRATGRYHALPAVDVYLALELGLVNRAWVEEMRAQQTTGEWLRQFLCKDTESQHFIWERHVRRAVGVGLAASLQAAAPLPGHRYKKRGLLVWGYDHLGHGENESSSKSALVVAEIIGNFVTFPFVHTWPADTDERVIERDLVAWWEYFAPDEAYGDAYGIGLLTHVNDELYRRGLTQVDRQAVSDGKSSAAVWNTWAFKPVRFEGGVKHQMMMYLRQQFVNNRAAIPSVDEGLDESAHFAAFLRQLPNIQQLHTSHGYGSYKMAEKKVGDDLVDAAAAAVWGAMVRGIIIADVLVAGGTADPQTLEHSAPPSLAMGTIPALPAELAA